MGALPPMKNLLRVGLLVLLTLAGCLEIDGQDITIHFDGERDRIEVLLVHRGLFAEGGSGSTQTPIEKALKDLADARERGEFAFWSNWPLAVNLAAEHPAPAAAVLAHIDVENGALFTDPRGVLCGYQFVRIRETKAFVKKLNTLFELWVQLQLTKGHTGIDGRHEFDADTKDLVREFLRSGQRLLTIADGRIEAKLPLSRADHGWLKRQLEGRFLANAPVEIHRRLATAARRSDGSADPTDTSGVPSNVQLGGEQLEAALRQAPTCRFLWDNDLAVLRQPDLTTLVLGSGEGPALQLRKASGGLYHDALLQRLRADGETIEDGVPDQELQRRFAAFRDRAAVLPPKLAALRQVAPPAGK
jgi:hypothetical protein